MPSMQVRTPKKKEEPFSIDAEKFLKIVKALNTSFSQLETIKKELHDMSEESSYHYAMNILCIKKLVDNNIKPPKPEEAIELATIMNNTTQEKIGG